MTLILDGAGKVNKVTITTPASGSTLTIADGKTFTANASITITGVDGKTLTLNGNLTLAGTDGKTLTVNNSITFTGTDGTTLTLPATSDTLAALGIAQSFTKAQRGSATSLTSSSASIAVDASLANNFTHTLTENTTLANPTNLVAGQSGVIVLTQHASSPKTLAFGGYWKFAGGTAPSLTATNSAVDVLVYYVESTTRITARMVNDVK